MKQVDHFFESKYDKQMCQHLDVLCLIIQLHSGFSFVLTLSLVKHGDMLCAYMVLIFESVDEILWCDHSNETSSAELLHCTIRFSILKFGSFLDV